MRAMSICAIVMTASLCGSAAAEQPLPGVSSQRPIVRPLPEPSEAAPASEDGSFMVGKTRVKISGSITVDIGVGATPKPR